MEGIDYSHGNGLTTAQITSAGKWFVCRYLSGGGSEDISKTEFDNLLNAGIEVALVWETTANRMADLRLVRREVGCPRPTPAVQEQRHPRTGDRRLRPLDGQ